MFLKRKFSSLNGDYRRIRKFDTGPPKRLETIGTGGILQRIGLVLKEYIFTPIFVKK